MVRAFFWTIFWGSLFLGAVVAGDVLLIMPITLLAISGIVATPYVYGGLTPRFHSHGQAYEPGSRRYRVGSWAGPLVLGVMLFGVSSFAGSASEAAGGSMDRLAGQVVRALSVGVGGLSVINGLVSLSLGMEQATVRRGRRVRRT